MARVFDWGVMAVPRVERPLDTGNSALLRFAAALRQLRETAGSPAYRVLARQVGYSVASLSQAAAGRKLPTLAVTLAYVRACGGDQASWERRWHEVAAELGTGTPPTEDEAAPYAGLAAFRPGQADRFFGRDRLVEELLSQLREHRLVTVVGASGSGKSSLLQAGLLPRLPPEWPVVRFTPGARPLEALDAALSARTEHAELVLVVDQFEELFSRCPDQAEHDWFIARLLTLATRRRSRCRVVLALRADHLPHCTGYPPLLAAQVTVGPMTAEELRAAIVQPAVATGGAVESALLARLVAEAHGQPGALPLLSHALLETWRRRRGNTLTLTGFLASGGMDGTLARTAESVYEALAAAEQRIARSLLLRLVEPGEDTARRVRRDELDPEDPATALVLDRLAHARLVTLDRDTVRFTHEALPHRWPRLRGWRTEHRELLRVHRRLTEATNAWESVDRDPGALYRGTLLDRAAELHEDGGWLLTRREQEFLDASRSAREQATTRRGTGRWRWLGGLATVLTLTA